jgi:hypothetical protein
LCEDTHLLPLVPVQLLPSEARLSVEAIRDGGKEREGQPGLQPPLALAEGLREGRGLICFPASAAAREGLCRQRDQEEALAAGERKGIGWGM